MFYITYTPVYVYYTRQYTQVTKVGFVLSNTTSCFLNFLPLPAGGFTFGLKFPTFCSMTSVLVQVCNFPLTDVVCNRVS